MTETYVFDMTCMFSSDHLRKCSKKPYPRCAGEVHFLNKVQYFQLLKRVNADNVADPKDHVFCSGDINSCLMTNRPLNTKEWV